MRRGHRRGQAVAHSAFRGDSRPRCYASRPAPRAQVRPASRTGRSSRARSDRVPERALCRHGVRERSGDARPSSNRRAARRASTPVRSSPDPFPPVSPRRSLSRVTWVSTTIPSSRWNALPKTTFAVLPPDAGQGHQLVHGRRDDSAEPRHDGGRHSDQAFRLGAKESRTAYDGLQYCGIGGGQRLDRGKALEQCRRHEIDAHVGGLGTQDRGHQQLVRAAEIELGNARRGIRGEAASRLREPAPRARRRETPWLVSGPGVPASSSRRSGRRPLVRRQEWSERREQRLRSLHVGNVSAVVDGDQLGAEGGRGVSRRRQRDRILAAVDDESGQPDARANRRKRRQQRRSRRDSAQTECWTRDTTRKGVRSRAFAGSAKYPATLSSNARWR